MTTPSTRQFKRIAQVVTDTAATGDGISIDELRISFKVTKTITHTPNTAEIKIYNLSPDTEGRIKGEFDDVILNAGYQGSVVLLFRGNIKNSAASNDGPNRVMQLACADGDRDFHNTTVNFSLGAGSTSSQLIDHIVSKFTTTKKGTIVFPDKPRSRGRVYVGMARDALTSLARQHDSHWSIQDSALQIVATDTTLPTEAIVITTATGMLEAPVRTDKGINVKCQLNPRLKPGGKIFLDNNDFKIQVAQARLKLPSAKPHAGAKAKAKSHQTALLDPDGIYKILKVEHEGDTRGPKWESLVTCVALGGIPAGRVAK